MNKYECPNCSFIVEYKIKEHIKEDVVCPMCSHKFVLNDVTKVTYDS